MKELKLDNATLISVYDFTVLLKSETYSYPKKKTTVKMFLYVFARHPNTLYALKYRKKNTMSPLISCILNQIRINQRILHSSSAGKTCILASNCGCAITLSLETTFTYFSNFSNGTEVKKMPLL